MATRLLLLLLIPFLAACGSHAEPAPTGAPKLRVLATTGMIADIARLIGGDVVEVTALMGPGVDPHLYTPRRSDMVRLSEADLILYHGLGLEGKIGQALESQATRIPVVAVAELVASDYPVIEDQAGVPDPHLWMDPAAWRIAAARIADVYTEHDGGNASVYQQNLASLHDEFDNLTAEALQIVASIQPDRRILITAHDAFGYFGRAFEVEVHGVQGISTESEAGLRDINQLVDLIVERRIPAVFAESTVNDRTVRSLIEGARARGHEVRLGGELFSDSLGPAGTRADTYFGMIRHNLETFAVAMGAVLPVGEIPAPSDSP